MKIKTIRDMEELETIRPYWESWQTHSNSDFEHFKLVCNVRKEIICPHVTVVEENMQPRLLLVGRLEQTSFSPAIGYFRPVRIPAKVLVIIYQGTLGEKDIELAEALVRYLWSLLASEEVDAVEFHHLIENSPLQRALLFHGRRWWCEKKLVWSTHWRMSLPEEPGFLLKNMRNTHRFRIRKKQKELDSAFPAKVSWRWMNQFDDIPGLCATLEAAAGRTYQRGLGAGFVDNEEYRQRFAMLASRGQLRVQLLEINGEVRAFWIGTLYKGVFHTADTGFDPNLRGYQPGTLMFIRMVDELAREGVRKLDFGLGDASYKQRFGDQSWREATVRLFAPTVKGLALRSSIGFINWLDNLGRNLLKQTKMLDRLKKQWRRQMTPPSKDEE
jgi:hypothetical protein